MPLRLALSNAMDLVAEKSVKLKNKMKITANEKWLLLELFDGFIISLPSCRTCRYPPQLNHSSPHWHDFYRSTLQGGTCHSHPKPYDGGHGHPITIGAINDPLCPIPGPCPPETLRTIGNIRGGHGNALAGPGMSRESWLYGYVSLFFFPRNLKNATLDKGF